VDYRHLLVVSLLVSAVVQVAATLLEAVDPVDRAAVVAVVVMLVVHLLPLKVSRVVVVSLVVTSVPVAVVVLLPLA
jgi:hypothetical protein